MSIVCYLPLAYPQGVSRYDEKAVSRLMMDPSNAPQTEADLEVQRLNILFEHDAAALAGDDRLTEITRFAADLCDTPICLVSLVEQDRQWFPAKTGLDVDETPRSSSFCAHAMRGQGPMVVADATVDPRFRENPLVTGEPNIRFYAGAPLLSAEGAPLGALCVIDTAPREALTNLQMQGLSVMATAVSSLLAERRAARKAGRQLDEQDQKFRVLADTMPQMVWSTLPDGYHDYYNARWYEFTGMPPGSTDGEGWNGMFHPDDQERAWRVWKHSLETGEPYEIEYRLRNATGEYRWTLGRALPIRDENGAIQRWFGTCTDIHDTKQLLEQREIIAHELSHRIKNIFAVISGLVSLSTRYRPEFSEVAKDLRDRITALGRAHDFVRPHSEASRPIQRQSSLHGMLEELLSPYREKSHDRIVVQGQDVDIDDRSATPLALVFHEFATNAAKYGALAVAEGQVRIHTACDGDIVNLRWIEQGGPPVAPPTEDGFGTKLIELSAARQLGGTVTKDWLPSGLSVTINLPKNAMRRSNGS